MFSKILLSFFSMMILGCASQAIDLTQIESDLQGPGVVGWVHGSVENQQLYVFTHRNPKDFFDYVIMSLVSEDPQILAQLKTLSRHDKVLIKGRFLKNPSPQKHIKISSLELQKKFESGHATNPYNYDAKIPSDLLKTKSAKFLVHAIAGEGKILVLEYKDAVVPMFVKNTSLTKDLFRNDIVEISYLTQEEPLAPTHLRIDESSPQPLKVLESIQKNHGTEIILEGALILFPQSPEIKMNIFALQQNLNDGLSRQFTLVNFEDPNEFALIRAKLQTAWDKYPMAYVNGRNKLVSQKLRVKAKGTYNLVSPSQANPQILLKSAADLEVIEN